MKKLIILVILLFLFFGMNTRTSAIQIKSDYIVAYIKYQWINWELYSHIKHYAQKYNLPPLLICSVIHRESKGKKYVRGKDGEYGYCQIMPVHFRSRKISYKLRFEPEHNIRLGCWYMAKAMKKSKGNIIDACRMYNAGLNSKKHRYRNWKYPKDIYNDYIDSLNRKKIQYASVL